MLDHAFAKQVWANDMWLIGQGIVWKDDGVLGLPSSIPSNVSQGTATSIKQKGVHEVMAQI